MGEAKLYGQNKGDAAINGVIKDYYAYAGENISAGDLVEYVNGIARQTTETSQDIALISTKYSPAYYDMSALVIDDTRVLLFYSCMSNGTNSGFRGSLLTIDKTSISVSSTNRYSENKSPTHSATILPDGKVFLAYANSSGYLVARVLEVNGTTLNAGSETQLVTTDVATGSAEGISVQALPNGNVFVAHSYSTNYYLYAMVCTISDTSITKGADKQLYTKAKTGLSISTCLLPNGNIFIAHSYDSNEYLYGTICTISGTTVSKASGKSLATTKYTGSTISACLLPNGNVFVAHMYDSDFRLFGIVCTISGTTITAGTDTKLSDTAYSGYRISATLLDDNRVFIGHSYTDSYYLYGMVCTISGTSITAGEDTQLYTSVKTAWNLTATKLANGNLFVGHSYDTSYYVNAQIWRANGNILTNQASFPEYETQVRKVTTGQFDGVAKTEGIGGDNTSHKDMVSIWTLVPVVTQEFTMADGNTMCDANGDIFLVREE